MSSEPSQEERQSNGTDPFYVDAEKYWSAIPATVDGMLGGFSHLSSVDLSTSNKFIRLCIKDENCPTGTMRALDCGAGIGRVTKRLLLQYFDHVDLVELNNTFLDEAHIALKDDLDRVTFFCSGLQDFYPKDKYDLIWCQWVLGHLMDQHLIEFFKRCKEALTENGVIIIKENLACAGERDFDEKDSCFVRNEESLRELISSAGLTVVRDEKQKYFPKGMYLNKLFALK